MSIDKRTVEHVALLARLELDEKEKEELAGQLDAIIRWVGKLGELNTDDVEPTAHSVELRNVLRPDETRPSLSVDEALANAPDRVGDYIRVPRMLDAGEES